MKKVLAIALGVLALAACNREAQPQVATGRQEVKFTTVANTFTMKAGETGLDGQTVRIFAGAPINANETGTVAGSVLTPANKIYWQENQTAKTSFAAVYPSDHATSTLADYDLAFGGSQDYGYHSTVLVASAKDVTPGQAVALDFKHPFSNVVIKVSNKLEGTPAITGVSISNVPAVGTIDMLAGTSMGGAELAAIGATAKENEAGTYQALIFPGKAKPTITVTTADASYNFVIASEFTFEANKSYNAAIELSAGTTPVPDGEEVTFNVTVSEWEDVSEDLGFEAEKPAAQVWSVIGTFNGTDWDKDFDMTETEDGVWEADITYAEGDEFKLRFGASWDTSAGFPGGDGVVSTQGIETGLHGEGAGNMSLEAAGDYHLRFIAEGYKLYILPKVKELYLLGDAASTGWSLDDMAAFTAGADGAFTWTGALKASGEFRFQTQKVSGQWWPALVQGADDTKAVFAFGDSQNNAFHVAADGNYTITVNAANPFAITVAIVAAN